MNASAPHLAPGTSDDAVGPLLAECARIEGWLARLGESAAGVPPHIAEHVRADYQGRLRQALDELLPLTEVMRARLGRIDGELHDAENAWAAAADKLEEVRLRHLAGELDNEAWEARSPTLHEAVSAADAERSRIRTERRQLSALLVADDEIATSHDDKPRTRSLENAEDLPWIELLEIDDDEGPGEAVIGVAERDHGAFLEDLDRAIAMAPESGRPARSSVSPGNEIGCVTCGAPTPRDAWYCDRCGGDPG